jgi:uncharacterized protein (DUF2141 family)
MHPAENRKPENASLVIEISGIRNTKGYILIALFNQSTGFPDQSEKAFRKLRIPANTGTIKASFDDLPPGSYAFGVVHDENDNQKLDTGLFGIPKEGFVFSRNAMGTMGPPSFKDAAIEIGNSFAVQALKIKYW